MKKTIVIIIVVLAFVAGLFFMLSGKPERVTLPGISDTVTVTHRDTSWDILKNYPANATAIRALAALRAEEEEMAKAQDGEAWEDDEPPTPEEVALKRWETVIEAFITELPPMGSSSDEDEDETFYPEVTEADQRLARDLFNTLTEEQKIEETHHAMNLLPDETVSLMYDILFDKTQNEDVIDIIFSDILNRDESIKNPVMEEIIKDQEHPMFVESSRILDITRPDPDEDDKATNEN